jgi:hypothetical protein
MVVWTIICNSGDNAQAMHDWNTPTSSIPRYEGSDAFRSQ